MKRKEQNLQIVEDIAAKYDLDVEIVKEIIREWSKRRPIAASVTRVYLKRPMRLESARQLTGVVERDGYTMLLSIDPQGSGAYLQGYVIRASNSYATADGARRAFARAIGLDDNEWRNLVESTDHITTSASPPKFGGPRASRAGQDWNNRQAEPSLRTSY